MAALATNSNLDGFVRVTEGRLRMAEHAQNPDGAPFSQCGNSERLPAWDLACRVEL